ncbi:MAG: leucine-rich repeat protein, partial [Clostridia bacterium]|nr:leucine-rich repeat protein [Clostridia bacterium]
MRFSGTAYYNDKSNWDSGVLYIGNHLIKAKDTITGTYTIKAGTKTIADSAFSDCKRLTTVTIPNSVTTLGDHAFSNCDSLTSVTIG